MKTFLEIGQAPSEEPNIQAGTIGYEEIAQKECNRFIEKLRSFFGHEPKCTQLRINTNSHDTGPYFEVVCYYDPDDKASTEYAFKCQNNGPKTWREKSVNE